ncbi:MAG: NAD(P)-dependent oxidoreductase, partial [Planctomycetota bacterium]|nr:NAD(P)-dependent oxidoreductase [Planctomycetota bacterium]
MHVALTGISGFIGSVLARRLVEAGHTVTGLVRPTSRRDHIEPYVTKLVEGDQDDENAWPDLLEGADCIIHNSLDWSSLEDETNLEKHWQGNVLGSLKLLQASAPRQFIYVSTIAVHHEMLPRWEGHIDEDHPMRPGTLYGACKATVEAHLWAAHASSGRHTSAFRPCAVYGLDPRLARSIGFPFVKTFRDGANFDRLGGGKFVHVNDVADAMIAAIGNPDASGKVYNLADCYARWSDLALMLKEHLGVETKIDFSSPSQPKNVFSKEAVKSLGVNLDRGHEGIKLYLKELIDAIDAS